MGDLKENVLERIDIVEFIGKTVPLKKSGNGYMGCCPFHGEKTGSFHVNPVKQKFHCFGCGKGGDVIDFKSMTDHLDFEETLEVLAHEYQIPIPEKKDDRAWEEHKGLIWVMGQAAGFYNWLLNQDDMGKPAREYLASRGVTLEQANEMGIGVAARPFWRKLKEKHLKVAEISGVIRKNKEGKYYDFLADRLIIPVRNSKGETIALTGRLAPWLGKEGPKYLNTQETPIFKKGATFFRLNPPAIRERGIAIIVEGQFDDISMELAGALNTTATCGTALTAHHIAKLRKLTKQALFLYDGDKAGQTAARRGIELAIEGGITPFISVLPMGEDPDSMVRTHGLKAIKALKRQDGFEYILEKVLATHKGTAALIQAVDEQIVPLLLLYKNQIARDARVVQVAKALGIEEKAVRDRLISADEVQCRMVALEKALLHAVKVSPEFQETLKKRSKLNDLFAGGNLDEVVKILHHAA